MRVDTVSGRFLKVLFSSMSGVALTGDGVFSAGSELGLVCGAI